MTISGPFEQFTLPADRQSRPFLRHFLSFNLLTVRKYDRDTDYLSSHIAVKLYGCSNRLGHKFIRDGFRNEFHARAARRKDPKLVAFLFDLNYFAPGTNIET